MRASSAFWSAAALAAMPVIAASGLADFNRLVVFGDSYTSTLFDPKGVQPSPSNPFGNVGVLKTNGFKWPQYLATKHNQTAMLLYNMAVSGSTVDQSIVPTPPGGSLAKQVDSFLSTCGNSSNITNSTTTTLYAFWFGINDVSKTFDKGDGSDAAAASSSADQTFTRIFERYLALLQTLRARTGAANFLLINVPPLQRIPRVINMGKDAKYASRMTALVQDFNARMARLAGAMEAQFPGARVWQFDANSAFDAALNETGKFPELAAVRDIKSYCNAYHGGTPAVNTSTPGCPLAVNQYFWLDRIHPTTGVQDLLAKQIANLLSK